MGNMISAALLAFNPDGAAVLAGWEAIVTVYEVVRELVSGGTGGVPVSDEVETTVEHLSQNVATNISDAANGLIRLRDVIISDYGRLQALGSVARGRGWNLDPASTKDNITSAASALFSDALVPIPYGVYAMVDHSETAPWVEDIKKCWDAAYGGIWDTAPDSAQVPWMGGFDREGVTGWFPTTFVLGRHELSRFYEANPPKEVTDPMFTPTTMKVNNEQGFGMQLYRFVWEQYAKGFPPTDLELCHDAP